MKKPLASAAQCARTIPILCVDPCPEDHAALEDIFNNSPWNIFPDSLWTLRISSSLKSAWRMLRAQQFPLVLCECDLHPGSWRELLALLAALPKPPFLIVTSRLADERLWAEALNLGAYDVLAKPFDGTEVTRVVSMAWMHWTELHDVTRPDKLVAVGGVR